MFYGILADAVLMLHLAFIVFVLAGGLLALRWPGVAWVHLPVACWGAAVEFTGWICPLTPLESRLRQASGAPTYTRSFIEHYLVPIIYPGDLTREAQIVLGVVVVTLNVVVYGLLWGRRVSRRTTRR